MAIEDVIAQQSVTMADQMLHIADWAHSEEDVRYECNKLIDEFLKKAGIKVRGRHEYHIGSGRLDSKYQGVLLEYKYPKGPEKIVEGKDAPGNKAVVKQLKTRFADFEKEERFRPERLFGVGCDADTLLFVRYQGGQWAIDEAQPVTSHSVERLLRALVSLGAQGKSFTPEYLSADFGSDSDIAQKGVRDLYGVITKTKSKKAVTFFNQWKILFGEICGYDVEGKSTKIEKLGAHYSIPDARPAELLFAVHSYYAIFMKFLAAEIAGSFSPLGVSVLKRCVGAPTAGALRREMETLEQGGIWSQLGITNFLEGDLFSWYLDAWDDKVFDTVHGIVMKLDDYDPTTLSVDPAESRDLLKKLYQQLFPKSVRHDLGEYYTPDWLAEHVLDELGYVGDPEKRVLDPACGSGTFLVVAINRIKAWFDEHRHECAYGEAELIQKILRNVIGFDLNPLAVMASRTNYLLAIRDLLKHAPPVEIPIYLCDSIVTPGEYGDLFTGPLGSARKLRTSAADFIIPAEIASNRSLMGKYADVLEFCVRNRYSDDDFLGRLTEEGIVAEQTDLHRRLFGELRKLDISNENGIWARIIKNAFAPLFIEKVDLVVGNPPWVNYENLPGEYREASAPEWQRYGLFPKGGWRARFAKGNTELAMIFVYATMDYYLRDSGRLGFVITQSVFQSKEAGRGFRAFRLPGRGRIRIEHVDDLTAIRPFEDAANRTATIVAGLGQQGTKYPVKYTQWEIRGKGRPDGTWELKQVLEATSRRERRAWPVAGPQSPWMILPKGTTKEAVGKIQAGLQVYRAWKGCDTRGGNGIFWLKVLGQERGLVVARNTPEFSRKKPPEVSWSFEPDLIYPLLKGRETTRWYTSPQYHLIYPHRGDSAIPETELKRKRPKTYAYFKEMETHLRNRRMFDLSFKKLLFYSLFETGDFLLAPYKVVWKYVATELTCAVQSPVEDPFGGKTVVIPDHKLVIVPFQSESEAHYVCALLNSSPGRFVASTYIVGTQISTHILEYVKVPLYDERNRLHRELASLSQRCHSLMSKRDLSHVSATEADIDRAAAKVWQLTSKEFASMQAALGQPEITQRGNKITASAGESD